MGWQWIKEMPMCRPKGGIMGTPNLASGVGEYRTDARTWLSALRAHRRGAVCQFRVMQPALYGGVGYWKPTAAFTDPSK
jgi:hypothetical protein